MSDTMFDPDTLAKLLNNPDFDPRAEHTRESLEEMLEASNDIAHTVQSPTDRAAIVTEGLFWLYDPSSNVYSLHVFADAQLQLDQDQETVHDGYIASKQPLIEIMVRAGATNESEARAIFRRESEKKDLDDPDLQDKPKKLKRPSNNRKDAQFVVHKSAFYWALEHAPEILSEYLDPAGSDKRKKQVLCGEELINLVGPEAYDKISQRGLEASMQSWSGFIHENRRKIGESRVIYIREVASDERYESLVNKFFFESGIVPQQDQGPDILGIFGKQDLDHQVSSIEDMIFHYDGKSFELAREVYSFMRKSIEQGTSELNTRLAVELARNQIRSNHLMLKMDREIQKRVRECSALWVRYALAGESIANDDYFTDIVFPMLKGAERTDSQNTFDVACTLARRCLDPHDSYSVSKYRYHMRGLWLLEKLGTSSRGKEREGSGLDRDLIDPFSHAVQRSARYMPHLVESFEHLLGEQVLDSEKIELRTSDACATVGSQLFDNLRIPEKKQFTWLQSNQPLAHKDKGYMVYQVVRALVGIHREEFKEIAQRYTNA